MEDKGIANEAIGSAKRWLSSAKINADAGNYDTALYSLEMSAEIAFKGLLFSLGMEVPKTHSIGDFVADAVKGNENLKKKFGGDIDKLLGTFNALMNLRPISGYIFETKSSLKELKKKYEECVGDAEKIVKACSEAVNSVK